MPRSLRICDRGTTDRILSIIVLSQLVLFTSMDLPNYSSTEL
jgi:hypothetical protein